MAKKKGKKKAILKRIASRRGERSRRKREAAGKRKETSSGVGAQELHKRAEKAYRHSAFLADKEEFRDLHLDPDILTRFLNDVQKRGVREPKLFLQEGVDELVTVSFLEEVKERLKITHDQRIRRTEEGQSADDEGSESATTAQFVLTWLEQGLPPSEIPFFIALFLRDVKSHPLADKGYIWKLIQPFFPSRIVTPESASGGLLTEPPSPTAAEPLSRKETKEEKRDKRFPHIILPR